MRERVYPALVPAADRCANGQLLTELTRDEWLLLDAFEDEVYDLALLPLDDDLSGWSYVAPADDGPVLPADWDPERFARTDLHDYVERCRLWRAGYEEARRA